MAIPLHRQAATVVSDEWFKKSHKFMLADLARSGLVPEDMGCIADEVNVEVRKEARVLVEASYLIPFYDLDGEVLEQMWRRRRQLRPGTEKLKSLGKYSQPHLMMAAGYGHYPYIPPTIWDMSGTVLHLCEGEKKTAAVIKLASVRAIGLTGKDVGRETISLLAEAIRRIGVIERICIWPDADVTRFDVQKSYGRLRSRLLAELYEYPSLEIDIMRPTWDTRKYKGIDDALAGGWKFAVGTAVGEELPLDMRALADEHGLDYSTGAKGDAFNLTINDDNICRTLEIKRLWGDLSLNSDNSRWMAGEIELDPEVEVMSFTRRFQRVFGMKKATTELVGRCVDHICRVHEVSPWRDYLEGLIWDGVGRLGGWLSLVCGAEDDEFTREVATKWLVSIVARTMNPGAKVDWMLILSGPQGCGKSSLPEALLPPDHGRLAMLAPHAQDKDLQAATGGCRILCFDEMAVFFKRNDDTEFIKQFVTATEDVYRPAYGRATVRRKRGSVLYGSTNRKGDIIRSDESGYRRWCIIDVQGVVDHGEGISLQFNWEWINANREQLWAEAVSLWRSGLNVAQVRGASIHTERYVHEPVDYDYYIGVLRGLLVSAKVRADIGMGVRISNIEFALAYREMFGKDPVQHNLTTFWRKWNCPALKANGDRYRCLSPEILAVLAH